MTLAIMLGAFPFAWLGAAWVVSRFIDADSVFVDDDIPDDDDAS